MILLAGSDYLATTYDDDDLRAGGLSNRTFGAAAFDFGTAIGLVELEGKPFGFGNTDTIRKRLAHAHLPRNGSLATIPIEWSLVSIGSKTPVTVQGRLFDVFVRLTPGLRSLGEMTLTRDDGPDGTVRGTFTASVLLLFSATFIASDDSSITMAKHSSVVMATNEPGTWATTPHRKIYTVPDSEAPAEVANVHMTRAPDTFDFYQQGGIFEGKSNRGGMITSAVG